MNCFTWINVVPVYVDIRWISSEESTFVSLVFHVYFSHRLLVYLSTCISGRYHVMFEPRFSPDVYSTWFFSRRSLL